MVCNYRAPCRAVKDRILDDTVGQAPLAMRFLEEFAEGACSQPDATFNNDLGEFLNAVYGIHHTLSEIAHDPGSDLLFGGIYEWKGPA